MVETVNRRIDKLPAFGLIIIDEAHIGNFNKLPFLMMKILKLLVLVPLPQVRTKLNYQKNTKI